MHNAVISPLDLKTNKQKRKEIYVMKFNILKNE